MRKTYVHADGFDINLLREPPGRQGASAATLLLAALFIASVAATGWLWREADRREQAALEQLSRVDRQLLELQAQNRTIANAAGAEALLAAADGLREFRPSAARLMERLNRILPVEANVQSLVYAGGNVQLGIDFASPEHVIRFLQEIEASQAFTLVSLGPLNNRPAKPEEAGGFGRADGAETFVPPFPADHAPELAQDADAAFPPADDALGSSASWQSDGGRTYLPVTGLTVELAYQPPDDADADGTKEGGSE
jgi:Tfp pilus assembly protein PilN